MRLIVSTIDTNSGSPRSDGTRLTCANVQSLWYGHDFSLGGYLATYDYLSRADVLHCLHYCAGKQCIANHVHSYCQQCTLDKRPEHPELARKYDEFHAVESGTDEVEARWRLAEQLLVKYEA